MVVNPTLDKEVIKSVLCDQWVYDRISEDGAPDSKDLNPPDNAIYLIDDDVSGLMIFHAVNAISYETHIQMLDRSKGMEFCQSCLSWFWDSTDAQKVIAQIPEIYPDVCRFAEKNGFQKEGVNKLSYLKDGEIYSQVYYGLTRPEV